MKRKILLVLAFLIVSFISFYGGYSLHPYTDLVLNLEKENIELKEEIETAKYIKQAIKDQKYVIIQHSDGSWSIGRADAVLPQGAKFVRPIEYEVLLTPTPIK